MTATLESLLSFCQRLEAAGQHGLTPFWREQAARLYGGTADTLVAQVGRGGVKSGFASRVAINEVLAGDFEVPDGEIHYWIDVSENKAEAQQRLRQYESYLGVLGVPFERRGDEIVIPELRRGFLVRAFDSGKVAGFRALGGRADELAKAANEIEEGRAVVSSLVAMSVTHRRHRPKLLLLSAPTGKSNYHYSRWSEGDRSYQITTHAPTWVANPSISEEDTRALEPHEPTWLMEYAAIASEGVVGMFFGERALTLSIDPGRTQPGCILGGRHNIISTDTAFTETGDRFGVSVQTHEEGPWSDERDQRELSRVFVHETHAWRADRSPRDMAARLRREVCDRYDNDHVATDQHEASSWKQLANDVGLKVDTYSWSGGNRTLERDDESVSKTQAFKTVRSAMLNGRVRLPDDPTLLSELRTVYSELSHAGNELIRIPRSKGGHGDRISALVMGVSLALLERPISMPQNWTYADYLEGRQRWCKGFGYFMPGAWRVFNADRDNNGQGRILSFPEMRRRIAAGEL